MVRVFTLKNYKLGNWPDFANFEEAEDYIRDNSSNFENGEIISLVDYHALKCVFIVAKLTMTFSLAT